MAQAQKTEWATLDEWGRGYHLKQWMEPKRSTVAFARFAESFLQESKTVVDICAGSGGSTAYLASQHPHCAFSAFELNGELIESGRASARAQSVANLDFIQGDMFEYIPKVLFDGAISLQTLSWLPDCASALSSMLGNFAPKWFGCTSLFFDGDITCTIEVNEHKRSRRTFYNVYSIHEIERVAARLGYRLKKFEPFEIDIDLPAPENVDLMQTYTVKIVEPVTRRLQKSGPLLMPWHMLILEKDSTSSRSSAG